MRPLAYCSEKVVDAASGELQPNIGAARDDRPQKRPSFGVGSGQLDGLLLSDFAGTERWVSFWFYFRARLWREPLFATIPGSGHLIPD